MDQQIEVKLSDSSPVESRCHSLILFIPEKEFDKLSDFSAVNKRLRNVLLTQLKDEHFTGKVGEIFSYNPGKSIGAARIILCGIGPIDRCDEETFRRAAASAAISARNTASAHVSYSIPTVSRIAADRLVQAVAEGALLGTYRFLRFKTKEDEIQPERKIDRISLLADRNSANQRAIERARLYCDATTFARDLVNEPANLLNPETLADVSKKVAKEKHLEIKILDANELKQLGAGAILGVGSGSKIPPRLIQLTYRCGKKNAKKVALVGKGITFDSGGLSLKPSKSMETMKCDMAGAAAVLSTLRALPEMKPDVDVIGILCAAENMPSGSAIRPGDVLHAMNGKSIEIINTDAEGRLVLSDGLSWAIKQKVDEIIDLATLTGACIVGLGPYIAGVMGNSDDLAQGIIEAGRQAGESFWKLPVPNEYDYMVKSDIADIKNLAPTSEAGAIQGALFLREFVGDTNWAHLDIAGPAWYEKDFYYIPKNGSGFGVRTLLNYLSNLKN